MEVGLWLVPEKLTVAGIGQTGQFLTQRRKRAPLEPHAAAMHCAHDLSALPERPACSVRRSSDSASTRASCSETSSTLPRSEAPASPLQVDQLRHCLQARHTRSPSTDTAFGSLPRDGPG